jgi:hypothetical protein
MAAINTGWENIIYAFDLVFNLLVAHTGIKVPEIEHILDSQKNKDIVLLR